MGTAPTHSHIRRCGGFRALLVDGYIRLLDCGGDDKMPRGDTTEIRGQRFERSGHAHRNKHRLEVVLGIEVEFGESNFGHTPPRSLGETLKPYPGNLRLDVRERIGGRRQDDEHFCLAGAVGQTQHGALGRIENLHGAHGVHKLDVDVAGRRAS